jgi:hypothetical protein
MMQAASDQQRLLELKREMWSRRCRARLAAFATEALAPRGEKPARHHQRICGELEALTRREITRLMVLAPPGAAKSTYTSRIFPAWFMARRPHLSVILVSHTSELSEVNSVHVQRIATIAPSSGSACSTGSYQSRLTWQCHRVSCQDCRSA